MSSPEPAKVRRVRSPCVSVCLLDAEDVCTGCYRNAAEITDWVMLDDDTRRRVIARSQERMRDAGVLFE